MPDPLVVRCPACSHLVRIPADYLGKTVTCLQCRAAFVAPANPGDQPTVAKAGGVPGRVLVPMFGLLLAGTVGLVVNAYMFVAFADPAAADGFARRVLEQLVADAPPDFPKQPTAEQKAELAEFRAAQEKLVADRAAEWGAAARPLRAVFAVTSVVILLGGVAFVRRRPYWLAAVGCLLAIVNAPDLGCCFPGAVVGLWGLFVLISDEGRRYFGRG